MHRVLEKIVANAEAWPDRPAILVDDRIVSYGQFLSLVRRFAFSFSKVCSEPKILIDLEKDEHVYAVMLGAWGSGGFYCPLNADLPDKRREYIQEAFAPDIVVTSYALEKKRTFKCCADCTVLYIEDLGSQELTEFRDEHQTSYVIFTSGSTGQPKGVELGTHGLDHYVSWAVSALSLVKEDVCSQHPNIGFDLSVLDIFAPLAAGAALVPFRTQVEKMTPGFLVKKHGISVWTSVPSVVNLLAAARHLTAEVMGSLRIMFFCGEPLLQLQLEKIFSGLPEVQVVNAYGPTEATVSCTSLYLDRHNYLNHTENTIGLGEPIQGMEIELEGGPSDSEGEIVIYGPQVALGYWKNPTATKKAFGGNDGKPYYRTGDWAQRIDGLLYFRNRIDRQVKIDGYRIEIEEIDYCLCLGGAQEAFTIVSNNKLCSFVVGDVDTGDLKRFLSERLPSYSIPSSIIQVGLIPRNNNDKIDVLQLEKMVLES